MHQAHRDRKLGGDLECACRAQGTNVIDHGRAGRYGLAHHPGFTGVHGNWNVRNGANGLDDRDHAIQLLLFADAARTRPRGLAADIENRGALTDHRLGMARRDVDLVKLATIRKRVGRDVENTHHGGRRDAEWAQVQHGACRNLVLAGRPAYMTRSVRLSCRRSVVGL